MFRNNVRMKAGFMVAAVIKPRSYVLLRLNFVREGERYLIPPFLINVFYVMTVSRETPGFFFNVCNVITSSGERLSDKMPSLARPLSIFQS